VLTVCLHFENSNYREDLAEGPENLFGPVRVSFGLFFAILAGMSRVLKVQLTVLYDFKSVNETQGCKSSMKNNSA